EGARKVAAGMEPRAAGRIIGALGEAGTKPAQHELADLLGSQTLSEDARAHAAIALGTTKTPTAETLAVLDAASQRDDGDVSATATLASGNAAFRLRDVDPNASNAEVDDLIQRYRAAPDDDTRVLLLRALGNTGDPRIEPALAVALGSESIAI